MWRTLIAFICTILMGSIACEALAASAGAATAGAAIADTQTTGTLGAASDGTVVEKTAAGGENWRFSDGWWRAELTGVGPMYSRKTDRTSDLMATGSFEYEFPMYARTTLGLRAYPLFYYHQKDPAEEIFGAGGGLATRIYQNEVSYDGWFGEAGGSLIWQSDYIDKNSSRVNFFLEAGVGYKFPDTDWHVALKFFHISNGSMGSRNTGTNGAGLSVGYSF